MATEHRVAVIAELRQFRETMATIPGIGAKEARDMARGIQRELQQATAAAKRAAKGVESGFKESFEKSTLFAKELASQFVPALAPIADVVEGVGSNFLNLAGAIGPVGTAAAAMAVAFTAAAGASAGVVYGAKAITDAAVQAEDALREAGRAALIDPEASAALGMYEAATERVSTAVQALTVDVGGDLAPALSKMADVTLVVVDRFRDWWPVIVDISSALQTISPLVWAFNGVVDASSDAAAAARQEYGALDNMFLGMRPATEAEKKAFQELEKAFAEYQKRLKDDAARAAAQEWRELLTPPATKWDLEGILEADEILVWARNTVEVADSTRAWGNELAGVAAGLDRIGPSLDKGLAHLRDASAEALDAAVDQAEAWNATRLAALQAADTIHSTVVATLAQAYADDLAAAEEVANEKRSIEERLTSQLQSLRQRLKDTKDAATRAELQSEISATKQKRDGARAQLEDAKALALEAWKDNQKAQAAAIGVNAAAAFGMTMATTPIPFPASLAAAGAASAAVLAQLIPIAAADPPKFHLGGQAGDELDVRMRRGEVALSPRDFNSLREVLQRLADQREQVAGATQFQVQIDGRDVPAKVTTSSNFRPNPFNRV